MSTGTVNAIASAIAGVIFILVIQYFFGWAKEKILPSKPNLWNKVKPWDKIRVKNLRIKRKVVGDIEFTVKGIITGKKEGDYRLLIKAGTTETTIDPYKDTWEKIT